MNIYGINISTELVMVAVLIFLLVTCLLQKSRRVALKPLNILIASTILLLICQIAEWQLMLASGDQTVSSFPAYRHWKELTYSLDYMFGYYSSVAFFYYASEHIRNRYAEKEQPYPGSASKLLCFLLIWGLIGSVAFTFCITQDWFYYLGPDGSEMFHRIAYLVLYLMAMVATAATVVILVQHRKILGKLNFILLLFYKVSPAILQIPDLLSSTCLSYLMRAFYTFVLYIHVDLRKEKELTEREAQLAVQEQELVELRTQIMLSQMQPHFLYNTLTTISSLCYLGNADEAREVVDKFASYFRQNMDSMGKNKFIPFEKELEHIQTYLWIEKVRFDDVLNVEYKIGPTNFRLPSLSLQPLVENAVKHGICRKEDSGTVTIETKETEAEFLVIVTDDGAGFDPDEKPNDGRSHVGIDNIRTRLETLCNGSLEIQSAVGAGTVATVHLPKQENILPE